MMTSATGGRQLRSASPENHLIRIVSAVVPYSPTDLIGCQELHTLWVVFFRHGEQKRSAGRLLNQASEVF